MGYLAYAEGKATIIIDAWLDSNPHRGALHIQAAIRHADRDKQLS